MRKYLTLLILFTAVAVALSGCVFNRHAPEAASDIALPEPEPEAQDMILGERAEASAVDVALYFPASDGAGFSSVTRSIRAEPGEAFLEAVVPLEPVHGVLGHCRTATRGCCPANMPAGPRR